MELYARVYECKSENLDIFKKKMLNICEGGDADAV